MNKVIRALLTLIAVCLVIIIIIQADKFSRGEERKLCEKECVERWSVPCWNCGALPETTGRTVTYEELYSYEGEDE